MGKMLPLTWLIISSALMYHLIEVTSDPDADLITRLPGQPVAQFKQFGGYIAVDQAQQRNLYYYFVEAEANNESKPLVLWLNGGPGCSSVGIGAFNENGPFRPIASGGLIKNDYSWNRNANMLYLESPAGVGFSYSTNTSFYNELGDAVTARDNLAFLQNWLVKFPQYKNRDLFLTGESYAGHYIPQLAELILQSSLKSNLKGIALGNPLLDFSSDFNSRAQYLATHGLMSDSTYGLMQTQCNFTTLRIQSLNESLSPACATVSSRLSTGMSHYIDRYDITEDVCVQSLQQQARSLVETEEPKELEVDVCIKDKTKMYLNRKDVQQALHARVGNWSACSRRRPGGLHYKSTDKEICTVPLLGNLIKAGVRVWVYSGDQDSVIPLISSRKLVDGLAKDLKLNMTDPYRSWLNEDSKIGGFTKNYGNILAFATIRGAGHETPLSQPSRSFTMFRYFLQGKPLPSESSVF